MSDNKAITENNTNGTNGSANKKSNTGANNNSNNNNNNTNNINGAEQKSGSSKADNADTLFGSTGLDFSVANILNIDDQSKQAAVDQTASANDDAASAAADANGASDDRVPSRDCQLHVGGIPLNITEAELEAAFNAIAPVHKCMIVREKTGLSKGFGFIDLYDTDGMCAVLDAEPPRLLDSVTNSRVAVRVAITAQKNQLYISGMPTRDMAEAELRQRIQDEAREQLHEFTIYADSDGQTYGYGWATFDDHQTALRAMRLLNGMSLGGPKPLSVSIATPRPRADPRELRKLKALFVRGVTAQVTEEELVDVFGGKDVVSSCTIPLDKKTQLPIGHAFVHFVDRPQAQRALKEMADFDLHGSALQLEWCLPPSAKRQREPRGMSMYGNSRGRGRSSRGRGRGPGRGRRGGASNNGGSNAGNNTGPNGAPLAFMPALVGTMPPDAQPQYNAYAAAAAYAQYTQYLAQMNGYYGPQSPNTLNAPRGQPIHHGSQPPQQGQQQAAQQNAPHQQQSQNRRRDA